MEKIVIIGSAGTGKSTFARKLGSILHIRVYHLDRIFWQRGWVKKSSETRIDILQHLVQDKQWIIEGSYLSSSEPRLNAADTVIFLDNAPLVCFQRIIKRHLNYHEHSRRDIPQGSKDKLTLLLLSKVLVFPFRGRRALKQKLRNYGLSKQIIWLRSGKEAKDFLAILEPYGYEER
jgi:adenylate kinase family enzyme